MVPSMHSWIHASLGMELTGAVGCGKMESNLYCKFQYSHHMKCHGASALVRLFLNQIASSTAQVRIERKMMGLANMNITKFTPLSTGRVNPH